MSLSGLHTNARRVLQRKLRMLSFLAFYALWKTLHCVAVLQFGTALLHKLGTVHKREVAI